MTSLRTRKIKGRTVYVYDYRDATGKRHEPYFPNREERDKFIARVAKENLQAAPPSGEPLTLEKYSQTWLVRIKPTIATKTHRTYGQMLRLYIVPILGEERMLALHEQLIGQFLTAWTNHGLSANTVRLIRATLSALCADAVEDGHLVRNPVAAAGGKRMRRAERRRQRAERVKKQRVLAPATYEAFLAEAKKGGLTYHALFTFMGDQGPRPDEALSLPWSHVSFRDGTAKVWATKTSSWRTVELTSRVIGLLRRLRTEQKRIALKD
ncbi:MAG: tyrosine-type recombinase/integrase, partial [Candidatus Binatia bacterium]